MRLVALSFLLTVVVFYATLGNAIYADEAYQTDFHHALLGLPQSHATFFHRPSPVSKASLLYTLSERLVLGAVNPKDGSIIWRQPLVDQAKNNTALGTLRAGAGGHALVTAVEETVSSWDAADGRMIWQWMSDERIKSLQLCGGENDALVLSGVQGSNLKVRRLGAENGAILWEHIDSSGDLPYAVLSSGSRVFYLSLHSALLKGYKIRVTELSASSGDLVGSSVLLSSENEVTSEDMILHVGSNSETSFLIWTDKSSKYLKLNILGTKQIHQMSAAPSNGNTVEGVTVHASSSTAAKSHILVHYYGADLHWAEVYHINAKTIQKAYELPQVKGKGSFSSSNQGADVYFIRHTMSDNVLLSSEDSMVLTQWNIQTKSLGGPTESREISYAISEVIPKPDSTYATRSALALSSGDWELVRNGEVSWVRPEGLAGAVAAAFVDIAREESLAEELAVEGQSDVFTAYVHRLKRHFRDLQYLHTWAEELPKRLLSSFTGEYIRSYGQSIQRDSFGFRKLVIVATEKGRLAALDVANRGSVVWNIQAVTLQPDKSWTVLNIDVEENSALIRAEGGEFLRFNPNTGAILQYQPGSLIPSLKTSISVTDASGAKVLIPINTDGSLGETPYASFGQKTVVVTQGADEVVKGWLVKPDSAPLLAWRFTPATGQKIISVSSRPPHDPVASIGKALGDRNVLYKYLNPNLLLVAVLDEKTSTVIFYVLDSTSGAIIFTTAHSGIDISKPITSIMSENWFAYSVYSETDSFTQGSTQVGRSKIQGYQLVVSELYESPYPNDRGPLASSPNSTSIYPSTEEMGDSVDTPHVISQTFLLPGPVSSMSVTSTLQGITTRSLLCTLPYLKSIISISRAFINARRPVGRDPTAAEAEEGLFRCSPLLDFEPKWMLNHKRELISISDIITSPALLESTSLVFAFGNIDLFGTRTAPIGAFDILGKGFSKLQLVLTVVALGVGTTIAAPFVRRKQIDGTWKA